MKIGFVQQGFEKLATEHLMAVAKKDGHDIRLIMDPVLFCDSFFDSPRLKRFFQYKDKLLREIFSESPDVIALTCLSDEYAWVMDIAKSIKSVKNIPLIIGGVHATSAPEHVAKSGLFDAVCMGEGEETLLEVLRAIENKEPLNAVQNVCLKSGDEIIKNPLRPLIGDLDSLPFPEKEPFYEKYPLMKKFYTMMTSRHCPFKCTFCYNSTYRDMYKGNGKYLRQRSPENVVEELVWAQKKYGFQSVIFNDDVFTANRRWLREFIPMYRSKVNKPFFCYVHPLYADEEITELLTSANCVTVNMGVQTLDPESRVKLFDRNETDGQIESAIVNIKKRNLHLNVGHIMGFHGDSEDIEENAARFYAETRPDIVGAYWLRLYPGTKITEFYKENNLITQEEISEINDGGGASFWLGGSVKNVDEIKPFSIFLNILPYLPKFLVYFLLKNKRYRFFKKLPFSVIAIAIRVGESLSNFKDLYGKWGFYLFWARMMYWFTEKFKGSVALPPDDKLDTPVYSGLPPKKELKAEATV